MIFLTPDKIGDLFGSDTSLGSMDQKTARSKRHFRPVPNGRVYETFKNSMARRKARMSGAKAANRRP